MTPEQFAYWLQGFVELNGGKQPEPEQWQSIQDHLKTVFVKVTPEVKDQRHLDLVRRLQEGYPAGTGTITC